MMKVWTWQVLFFYAFCCHPCKISAIDNRQPGARAGSLSTAVVALPGCEGLFHNQASLAYLNSVTGIITFESVFFLKEFPVMAAGLAVPAGYGTFSAGFSRFGSTLYHSDKYGFSFSRRFGNRVAAALQFDLFSEKYPENKEAFTAFCVEGGIIAGDPGKFLAGLHFFNPVMAKMKYPWGIEPISRTVRAGCVWLPEKDVTFCFEMERTNRGSLILKTGIEFFPAAPVSFRAGVSGIPLKFTAGFGLRFDKVIVDMAFTYHGNLGFTPSAGIIFEPWK